MRWSAHRAAAAAPGAADAHAPASLGAGLRTQVCKLATSLAAPADNLASTSRARTRSPSPYLKSQIHGCAPGKVPVIPAPSPGAPFYPGRRGEGG